MGPALQWARDLKEKQLLVYWEKKFRSFKFLSTSTDMLSVKSSPTACYFSLTTQFIMAQKIVI